MSSSMPAINTNCHTFIRPLTKEHNEPPLKLTILHGKREFKITLRLAENENGSRISMRHLSEVVLEQTGIIAREQRFCFRGLTWSNPDLSPWSPALRDLGMKNGDRVQLVVYHDSVPDWEAVRTVAEMDKRYTKILSEIHSLFHRLHGIQLGYVGCTNQLMSMARLRQSLDNSKEKLMALIRDLNGVHFDHRNFEGQAKRRQILTEAQLQIDKCDSISTCIFHKLAQSKQLSTNGSLYSGDPMLTLGRSGRSFRRRK